MVMENKKKFYGMIGEVLELGPEYNSNECYKTGDVLEEEKEKTGLVKKLTLAASGLSLILGGYLLQGCSDSRDYNIETIIPPSQFEELTDIYNQDDRISNYGDSAVMQFKYTREESVPFINFLEQSGIKKEDMENYKTINPELWGKNIKKGDSFNAPKVELYN